jgi:hypothetical protein
MEVLKDVQSNVSENVRQVVDYYLHERKRPTLAFGETYTADDLDLLASLPKRFWQDFFDREVKEYDRMVITLTCQKCGNQTKENDVSKTRFLEVLRSRRRESTCEECKKQQAREQEEQRKRRKAELEKDIEDYICSYLDPERSWKKDYPHNRRWRSVSCLTDQRVVDAILDLEYCDFLKTPYWKAVAWKVKQRAGFRCQMCNSEGQLHAHHRTYEHHGHEHLHMNDLIALCEDCHHRYHQEEQNGY